MWGRATGTSRSHGTRVRDEERCILDVEKLTSRLRGLSMAEPKQKWRRNVWRWKLKHQSGNEDALVCERLKKKRDGDSDRYSPAQDMYIKINDHVNKKYQRYWSPNPMWHHAPSLPTCHMFTHPVWSSVTVVCPDIRHEHDVNTKYTPETFVFHLVQILHFHMIHWFQETNKNVQGATTSTGLLHTLELAEDMLYQSHFKRERWGQNVKQEQIHYFPFRASLWETQCFRDVDSSCMLLWLH